MKKKILTSLKNKGNEYECKYQRKRSQKGQIQNKCNKEMKSAASEWQLFTVFSVSSKTSKEPSASDQVVPVGDI